MIISVNRPPGLDFKICPVNHLTTCGRVGHELSVSYLLSESWIRVDGLTVDTMYLIASPAALQILE